MTCSQSCHLMHLVLQGTTMCHEEWKQRTARELQYFRGGVSRHAIWRTATYLSPWSLVVHITSDRQVWIPPQPGHTKLPDDAARVAFAQYSLGGWTRRWVRSEWWQLQAMPGAN